MKFSVEALVLAPEGAKRNDKLPLLEKLRVQKVIPPHPKNVEAIFFQGTMAEIVGTIDAGGLADAVQSSVAALVAWCDPDGFLEIDVTPK